MIDVLVLLICGIAALVGWRRGTVLTLLPLVGLVAGYTAAFTLFRPLGAPLIDRGVPPVVAYPAAGLGVLLAVVLLFRVAAWWVRRREDRPSDFERALGVEEDELAAAGPAHRGRSVADRTGGAVLNALWAFGVLMILVWAAESFVAVRGGGGTAGSGGATDRPRTTSVTGRVAGEVVGAVGERITESRLGDAFSASAVGAFLRDPGEFRRMLDALAERPAIRRLVADPEVGRLLAEGQVAELARHPELEELLEDEAFRDALQRLGVVGEDALSTDGLSTEELAAALTGSLGPVAGVITSLREEGELRAMAERLDLSGRLRDGDLLALLTDTDFAAVAARVAERLRGQAR